MYFFNQELAFLDRLILGLKTTQFLKSIKVHLERVYKTLYSYILVDKISKLKNGARHKIRPLLPKSKTPSKTPNRALEHQLSYEN